MNFQVCVCGKPAVKEQGWRYCSDECKTKAKRMKTRKNCLHCGKEFFTFKKNLQKYCSHGCMVKHKNQRHRVLGDVNPLMPYVRMGISCKGAVTSPKAKIKGGV